ncbi:NUDIX hydrolase [Actinomadura verrucosospora]
MNDGRSYPSDLPRHSVSAGGAVIRDDGRFLVIERRDNGAWVQPGGVVELEEDPRETVVREVLEETGVRVEAGELTGVYKNMKRGVVSLVFRCRVVGGEAHPTDEAVEVAWLTKDDVRALMAEPFAVGLLDSVAGGAPAVRIHDGHDLLD